jgi:hypothetical protein
MWRASRARHIIPIPAKSFGRSVGPKPRVLTLFPEQRPTYELGMHLVSFVPPVPSAKRRASLKYGLAGQAWLQVVQ